MKKILTFSIILNIVLIAFLCYSKPSVNIFHSKSWENVKSRIIEKERANMHLTLQSLPQRIHHKVIQEPVHLSPFHIPATILAARMFF